VLRTKAFLGRAPGDTSIYRERTQTFYYDAARPGGYIQYPPADGWALSNTTYGVKVRTDLTVEEVWYNIEDTQPANDDGATGAGNGNNAWVKAVRGIVTAPKPGDPLEQQWEFNYVLIPTGGVATIKVRLRELSSSTNQALSDADGHFTTLLNAPSPPAAAGSACSCRSRAATGPRSAWAATWSPTSRPAWPRDSPATSCARRSASRPARRP
jgi:hypothetical protein